MMAVLMLLFCNVMFIIGFVDCKTEGFYAIPEPDIVAFQGGGLRVIVQDDSDISVIRFHANVNEEMKQLYPGTINIETSTKINGKWILEDRNARFNVADIIYYWIFVEKDRLGYVKQPVKYRIRELVPYYSEGKNSEATTRRTTTTEAITTHLTTTAPTICPQPIPDTATLTSLQEQMNALNRKLDLITSISALQAQVDILGKKFDGISSTSALQNEVKNISNTVVLLQTILESLPEAKSLTLSGVIPPDLGSNPDHIVRYVIWEKLELRVNVVKAIRKEDGSIVFELGDLQEKVNVLNEAKEKLKGSRIVIS